MSIYIASKKKNNKTYKNQGYLGDKKLYKKTNLLCLFILSCPQKGNRKNKNEHFNSNAHEEKIYSKERKFSRFIFEFEWMRIAKSFLYDIGKALS